MIDSVSTWRVYSAEQSVPLGDPLPNIKAARDLVRRVKRSAWWRHNIEYDVSITTEIGGRGDLGDEWISSFASGPEAGPSSRWRISIHPRMLNELIVLHELAHCIAPRFQASQRRRKPGELNQHRPLPDHGDGFAGVMSELVREFATGAKHNDLREAYEHFQVPTLSLENYKSAVTDSIAAELDILEMRREFRDFLENEPMPPPPPGGWKVPRFIWGDIFVRLRLHPRRIGLDRLAKTISAVELCSRRALTRIEESEAPPSDPRLRRIAMCYAVAMNIDPIYLRHRMGLVRWECGVELDELRAINAGWVDLVESMNRQIQSRPPRWAVDGDR
ncbi:hypothetical protein [Aeromicrobium alkaliterrae]|uniref:hypothetical protein n=1 Tax=Aeromicrobium alkaliterrae TaxID=302168 RepID=UPI0031D531DC